MWFGLLSLVGCSPVSAALDAERFGVAIRTMLSERHHPFLTNHDLNTARDILTSLYEQRRYQPLWVPEGRPSRQAISTLQALRAAADDGLRADDYEANKIIYELIDSVTDAGATAVATQSGEIYFFEDLYEHDAHLEALLEIKPVSG